MPLSATEESALKIALGKGVILFWKDFEFETGERKDSLFLFLSDCKFNCFIAIRATTQTEFYERPSKMIREFLIVQPGQEGAFPKKSAIDFSKIRVLHWEKIRDEWGEAIKKLSPASDDLIKKVDQLVSQSKIVRKDWIKWITLSQKQS